jgi:hypothetical protein
MASADMLRRVRAGQAPEATAHGYDDSRSFLEELYPGNGGEAVWSGTPERSGAARPPR